MISIIAIGASLYFMLLLFFFSLFIAAKRGDAILNNNELMATEPLPNAALPHDLSKSVEKAKEITQKISTIKKNQNPLIGQPDIY